MPVICNSGPLIALGKPNHLKLLATRYTDLIILAPVVQEVVVEGLVIGMSDALTVKLFVVNRQVKGQSIPLQKLQLIQCRLFWSQVR
jgi:CRISPR/Cas system-associated exonuclease Cas4 (RecB family)